MYYSDNIKVRVTDYSELSKYNYLPTGAIIIVENPIPHKWMRIEGAWINMNQYKYKDKPTPYILEDIKEGNKYNRWNKIKQFLNTIKNIN
jgi:hypothetical protein